MLEAVEDQGNRPATLADVHALAESMPHVTRVDGTQENPVYQVGGKSFVFFRTPRPDAAGPEVPVARIDLTGPAGTRQSPRVSPRAWPSRSRQAHRSGWPRR